jgi:hypothetical protein
MTKLRYGFTRVDAVIATVGANGFMVALIGIAIWRHKALHQAFAGALIIAALWAIAAFFFRCSECGKGVFVSDDLMFRILPEKVCSRCFQQLDDI